MNRPDPNDALIRRYREASAQDQRRPSAQVREAVRAHAEMIAASKAARPTVPSAPAANQSRWKISLLASIALAGLTGLLVLQFDRGTPDEQETALGRPAPAPAVPPSPAVADAKAARSEAPAAPAPLPKAAVQPARPAPDVGVAAPAAASPPRPADPEPPAEQHAPARERAAEAARDQASEKAMAPAAPQAMTRSAAAPALRMPAPAPAQESLAAQAPRSAAALDAALHRAARAGQVAEAEALLQQGAAINAPDSAGRTALVLAVIHGHNALVRRLLALGANPALADSEGLDALQHARRLGRDDMARLIEARS